MASVMFCADSNDGDTIDYLRRHSRRLFFIRDENVEAGSLGPAAKAQFQP